MSRVGTAECFELLFHMECNTGSPCEINGEYYSDAMRLGSNSTSTFALKIMVCIISVKCYLNYLWVGDVLLSKCRFN